MAAENSDCSNTALGFQSLLWQIGDQIGVAENEKKKIGLSEEVLRSFLHDIKSPLSVVGLLRPRIEKWDGEAAELLMSALNQIESLSKRLKETPSAISHTSSQVKAPAMDSFSFEKLGGYLTELMKSKSLEYKGRGVFLATVGECPEGSKVPGDLAEWQALISNFVNNSVESSSNFSRIRVELQVEGRQAVLTVHDSGTGLSEAQLKSFNSGITWSSKGMGRGLGLKRAIQYVESLGGKVEFRNRQPGGLSVKVCVPVLNS